MGRAGTTGHQCRQGPRRVQGRKPSIKLDEVRRLRKEGLGATEIARKLGVGRASVYRVLMR